MFRCGACGEICAEPEAIHSVGENSIQCDSCHLWWHWMCMNIQDEDENALIMDWFCPDCERAKQTP